MNATAIPAGSDQAGRQHVNGEAAVGADERQPDQATGQGREPGDRHRLGTEAGDERGAAPIIPTMIVTVSGSSAAPLANAPTRGPAAGTG